jgi:hypothetical protein
MMMNDKNLPSRGCRIIKVSSATPKWGGGWKTKNPRNKKRLACNHEKKPEKFNTGTKLPLNLNIKNNNQVYHHEEKKSKASFFRLFLVVKTMSSTGSDMIGLEILTSSALSSLPSNERSTMDK